MNVQQLTDSMKEKMNENRRLRRRIEKLEGKLTDSTESSEIDCDSPECISTQNQSSSGEVLWQLMTPTSKKKVKKLAAISGDEQASRVLRKELNVRVDCIAETEQESLLRKKVKEFMMQDHVSIPTPDKKKKNLRYRLGSLLCLHEQFIAEYNMDIHYSTFCSYVPETGLKPKPEDLGTCLCMTCLNPELKLESLTKFDQLNKGLDVQLLVNNEEEMKKVMK